MHTFPNPTHAAAKAALARLQRLALETVESKIGMFTSSRGRHENTAEQDGVHDDVRVIAAFIESQASRIGDLEDAVEDLDLDADPVFEPAERTNVDVFTTPRPVAPPTHDKSALFMREPSNLRSTVVIDENEEEEEEEEEEEDDDDTCLPCERAAKRALSNDIEHEDFELDDIEIDID